MPRLTETRALSLKKPTAGQTFFWCSEVKGFGVRLTPGSRSYIVQCRWKREQSRITLGPVGILPFEGPPDKPGARDLALVVLNAARRGDDPRKILNVERNPDGITVAALWAEYVKAGFPKIRDNGRKRPSTIRADQKRYELLIAPELGEEAVESIDTARVKRWINRIPTVGQGSHALALLKSLFSFGGSRGLASPQKIEMRPAKSRQQQDFYRPEELARLDRTLVDLIGERPAQILQFSALRLLIATGARLGEILSLKWADVDITHAVLHLQKDKTSDNRRDILLTPAAVQVFQELPRTASEFVFFADSKTGHMRDVQRPWVLALSRSGIRRLRKHDLRHSFASTAIRQGVSLYTVGKLLGHRQATTTQRYAHLEQDVAREALDKISYAIRGAI